MAESEANRQQNKARNNRNQSSSTLSSTVCLPHTIFEDLGCAIELHEKIANEDAELHSLDPRNYLSNGKEEGDDCIDYLFGQGIINEDNSDDKKYLQLYESWFLFAYREFYKICLQFRMKSVYVHLEKRQVSQTDFCEHFGLHNDERIHAYLMKLSNNTNSDSGFSYETVMNSQSDCSGITQPCQFSLGNIPTMSGITDSVGEGWDERKIQNFFQERNNIVYQQEEVPMITSKHFEQAYITLSMMTKIKLKERKFIHH